MQRMNAVTRTVASILLINFYAIVVDPMTS